VASTEARRPGTGFPCTGEFGLLAADAENRVAVGAEPDPIKVFRGRAEAP